MGASVALKIQLPAEERGRSDADLQRIDRLRAKLARVDLKPQKRKDVERELEALLSAPARAAQAAWETAAAQETHRLAEARGEVVEAKPKAPLRIVDRDPLLSLARAGRITIEQCDIGHAVRQLYDLRKTDTASAPFDGMPAGRHDHERFIGSRLVRAKGALAVGQLETAILNGHFRSRNGSLLTIRTWADRKAAGDEPHIALKTLRWVCDEGHALSSMGSGRAYERHCSGLIWALDIGCDVLDKVAP